MSQDPNDDQPHDDQPDNHEPDDVDRWAERRRIAETARGEQPWSLWGPYLSERQWGTVREDYSPDGNAWRFLSHEDSRSRAYRWGEDGIAGISDDRGLMCLSLALWNGRDRILKERLFGLTNEEGNHGEDVKEVYFYSDAVPSHAYLKLLYRYPQAAYPYADLLAESRRRGRDEPEYELVDTGVFDGNRYFDVTVEYAKADVDDIHMRVTATNRGDEPADLHLVPQLWYRNIWSWKEDPELWRPQLSADPDGGVLCRHPRVGTYRLAVEGGPDLLFCENETNVRLHGGSGDVAGPFKDGLNSAIVDGDTAAAAATSGTKLGVHHALRLGPGETATVRLRLSAGTTRRAVDGTDATIRRRIAEADAFYETLGDGIDDQLQRRVADRRDERDRCLFRLLQVHRSRHRRSKVLPLALSSLAQAHRRGCPPKRESEQSSRRSRSRRTPSRLPASPRRRFVQAS